MIKFLTGLIVWIIVVSGVAYIIQAIGGSEFLQGGFGVLVAIHLDRALFPEDN